jgi:hypothetical protein
MALIRAIGRFAIHCPGGTVANVGHRIAGNRVMNQE